MKQIYILFLALYIGLFQLNAQTIWTGTDLTFTKEALADWTLTVNQDIITPDIAITRQDSYMIYNYQWFQTNFGADAIDADLSFNFWNNDNVGSPSQTFTATGGPKGLKWAILDDTGSTTDWSGFSFYGTLGNPANFYSLHNVLSMIYELENDNPVTSIDDDFRINGDSGSGSAVDPVATHIVGKNLGVWIEADDIYFTIKFNSWGQGGAGGGAFSYTRSTDQNLSTNEIEKSNKRQVYPNPSSENIQVLGLTKTENYKVYNIMGSELSKGNISDNEEIEIKNFTNGLYFLKFDNGYTLKFIKE